MSRLICLSLLLALFVPACGTNITPTPTLTATPTSIPIETAVPTQSPTPTQEVLSLPENLGGDVRYATEIEKHDWSYNEDKTAIFVNWQDTGTQEGYEEAFKLNEKGEWEIIKFVLKRGEVDVDGMSCKKIGTSEEVSCIQLQVDNSAIFRIKFVAGDLVYEQRTDPATGEVLPGHVVYIVAHTRREPGSHEEIIKIALSIDMGDGKNAFALVGYEPPAESIFDLDKKFAVGSEHSFGFMITKNQSPLSEYYGWLNNYTKLYKQYYDGLMTPINEIFYPASRPSGGGNWY